MDIIHRSYREILLDSLVGKWFLFLFYLNNYYNVLIHNLKSMIELILRLFILFCLLQQREHESIRIKLKHENFSNLREVSFQVETLNQAQIRRLDQLNKSHETKRLVCNSGKVLVLALLFNEAMEQTFWERSRLTMIWCLYFTFSMFICQYCF